MVEGPASSDSVIEDEGPAPDEEGSGILGPMVSQETKTKKFKGVLLSKKYGMSNKEICLVKVMLTYG
jgi:hypothetical protein